MTEKITDGQKNQISRFFEDVLDALGFSKEEAQEIIKAGGVMQNEIKPILRKLAIADKYFGPAVKEFDLTIPADYNHDTQIDTSGKKTKKEKTTYDYDDDLNSKNFAKATNKLVPGKTYKVKIFPILQTITSEDCILFLKKQNAVLVGGQGATLVYDLAKDQLLKDKWTVSFDEKDALWEDADGRRGVPVVCASTGGVFRFYLGGFGDNWGSGSCVLCFCDLSA